MTDTVKNKRIWTSHIWSLVRFGLALFLIFNLYALALRYMPVPSTILIAQRGLAGEDVRRDWTPLSEISPYIVQAVMAGEDSRFCEHEGIDWAAIEQAFEDNQGGKRRRGGSTITQQTAKNVFFWNGGGYIRKAGEAWFASLIYFVWGKSRVMEVYLNVAEWGDGIFGIEAAAQNRFGKPAKDITRQEAALLAAVLPSPNKWRLNPPSDFVSSRAGTLEKRMTVIRDSEYDKCVTGTAKVTPPRRPKIVTPEVEGVSETESNLEETASLDDILDKAEESLRPPVEAQKEPEKEDSKEPPE